MFECDAIAAWFSVIDYFVGSLLFLHMFIISLYKQPSLKLCVHNWACFIALSQIKQLTMHNYAIYRKY